MSFNIPHSEREKVIKTFKRHILDTVILRMDFADLFDAKELASKIVAKFATDFPQRSEQMEELLGQTESAIVPVKKITSHLLSNVETRNHIKVSPNSISFEYKTYETFEGLIEAFKGVFTIYQSLYPGNQILRIGLRKINFYDKGEEASLEKFEGYLNDLLLPGMNNKYFDVNLSQELHIYMIKGEKEEEPSINFKYGTVKMEGKRRLVIDVDGYSSEGLTGETVIKRFKQINNKIFDIFFWSIGEKTKEYLIR